MRLSFGQVEELMARMHGVVARRRTMLRSRLQHLQKEDLPPGVAVGRGARFAYGLDEVFMLVVALELARARMPAAHAARLVRDRWHELRPLVDAGLSEAAALASDPDHHVEARWMVIAPDGLALARREEAGGDAGVEGVHDVSGTAVGAWAQRRTPAPGSVLLVVDLVGRVVEAAGHLTRMVGFDPADPESGGGEREEGR